MPAHITKFKTEMVGDEIVRDSRIDELRKWAKILNDKKLVPIVQENISCGNLSFRLKNGENKFVITASQLGYNRELSDEGFVLVEDCDFEKGIVYARGARLPSSESMLHFAIYRARPEVNVIFHGHSEDILENSKKLGLVETKTEEPYGTVELANSVLEVLEKNNLVVMKNHGFVALGENIEVVGDQTVGVLYRC